MLAFPVGILGTQFEYQAKIMEEERTAGRVIKEHQSKIVEAKLRSLRKELGTLQMQLSEFEDIRTAAAFHKQEMVDLIAHGTLSSSTFHCLIIMNDFGFQKKNFWADKRNPMEKSLNR